MNQAISVVKDDRFTCTVCEKLAMIPMQCGECQKLVCWFCQLSDSDGNFYCNQCAAATKIGNHNKQLENDLMRHQVKCSECKEIQVYKYFLYHKCKHYVCHCKIVFLNLAQLRTHLINDCD